MEGNREVMEEMEGERKCGEGGRDEREEERKE